MTNKTSSVGYVMQKKLVALFVAGLGTPYYVPSEVLELIKNLKNRH